MLCAIEIHTSIKIRLQRIYNRGGGSFARKPYLLLQLFLLSGQKLRSVAIIAYAQNLDKSFYF